MKLISLTIENFRQFYGKQEKIYFSDNKERNVTLLLGANGAGKSALLNAFTWALYKKTTPSFEHPKNIINERVIYEADVDSVVFANVVLVFEHNKRTYTLTRSRSEKKTDAPDKTSVLEDGLAQLMITDTDGNTQESKNPEDHLDQVLPSRLHNFFFFDGERIEQLAKDDAYEEVENAIKSILGLQILDRSINHLKSIKTTLDNQLLRVGTKEIQDIINQIQKKENEKEKLIKKIKTGEENTSALSREKETIKQRLRNLEETKKIQETLDDREEELGNVKDKIYSINKELSKIITRYGYTAFINPLIRKSGELLNEKRKKKELPSGIKKQFVEDLLLSGTCICGVKLRDERGEPNDHYREVEGWLNKAGVGDIEEHAISVGIQLKDLLEKRESFYAQIHELLEKKAAFEVRIAEINEEISELKHNIKDKDSEEIKKLVDKSDEIDRKIGEEREEKGANKQRIETIEQLLQDLEREKEEADMANERANLIKHKSSVRGDALSFFSEVYSIMSNEVRKELDERVREVHNSISYKNFWTEITEDFRLVLRKGYGEEVEKNVAKSTGESQITSLAFIGSIADYARNFSKNNGINKLLGFDGGIYPIVMDSPFGNLDNNYKKSVSEGIPRLAEQVVIIVSKSQGEGIVLDNLKNRVDKAYVISFCTNKDGVEENIEYSGRSYPYIVKSSTDFEYAKIMEASKV